jgi:glutamyl-tRNA reductase
MRNIVLIGLNHNTASVDIRERLSFSEEEIKKALDALKEQLEEIIIFSTCNRTEFLLSAPAKEPDKKPAKEQGKEQSFDIIKNFISVFKNLPLNTFEKSLYIYEKTDAVRHTFRVAASLDSMMLGEAQILGQIKEAYKIAINRKSSGVILNRLLHKAFFTAKKIRTETGIGDSAVSISYAAVELAKKIFESLENKDILLIGAGEMAELAVEHLIKNKAGRVYIANRTFEKGVKLAQKLNGTAIKFQEIENYIEFIDIVISSTNAEDFTVKKQHVKKVIRKRRGRPLFFIDIAVPRDIDPNINNIGNSYVYDIDDLKNVIDENIGKRKKEAVKAERFIDEAVFNFQQWFECLEVVPTIVALKDKMKNITEAELKKTASSLKYSEKEKKALAAMLDSIINKLLHDPIMFLKNKGHNKDKTIYIDITKKLFNIDNKE